MKPVLPVTKSEFLGCTIVHVDDYFNPNAYPQYSKRHTGPLCAFCGKAISDDSPWHLTGVNGNVIQICSIDDAEKMMTEDNGFMGAFPIGSECARKVRQAIREVGLDPNKYVFRLELLRID